MFKKIDYNGSKSSNFLILLDGVLEEDDLRWGFRNYGIHLLDNEIKVLIQTFDKNQNGVLEYNELVEALNVFIEPYVSRPLLLLKEDNQLDRFMTSYMKDLMEMLL